MKVLIGYDGSPDADWALQDLKFAGLPEKGQASVLTVTTVWQPNVPGLQFSSFAAREALRVAEQSLQDAEALAAQGAEKLKKLFPGWKISSGAVVDTPAEGLIKKALEWKPNLLVLGCHGRSALGRLLMGSVSQKVLHHGTTDLRIVRLDRPAGKSAPRILLPVDGSVGSDAAVAAVASRKWPRGARIRVLAALGGDSLSRALAAMKASDAQGRKWMEKKSEAAAESLRKKGFKSESVLRVGDPRIVILREAMEWSADCIFLGSRGLGGIDRFLLGSVSSSVAAHADCTVEIVRKKRTGKRLPG